MTSKGGIAGKDMDGGREGLTRVEMLSRVKAGTLGLGSAATLMAELSPGEAPGSVTLVYAEEFSSVQGAITRGRLGPYSRVGVRRGKALIRGDLQLLKRLSKRREGEPLAAMAR